MECPYCHTEYTSERPCFCHTPAEQPKRSPREEYYTASPAEDRICVNSHRGVRLD